MLIIKNNLVKIISFIMLAFVILGVIMFLVDMYNVHQKAQLSDKAKENCKEAVYLVDDYVDGKSKEDVSSKLLKLSDSGTTKVSDMDAENIILDLMNAIDSNKPTEKIKEMRNELADKVGIEKR